MLQADDPLPRAFYARPSVAVARALLGRVLVSSERGQRLSGRIVEVEAYGGARDPASHAYQGLTARNATMFGRPGHAYVYFTYGMHFCMNVVTGAQRHPSAVLLRALEPIDGIQLMRRRRGVLDAAALARGPGNLARAFGISRRHDGLDLTEGALWVSRAPALRQGLRVAAGPRIGIRRARTREWRFFLAGHPCVSGPRRGGARRGGAAGPGARPRDRR